MHHANLFRYCTPYLKVSFCIIYFNNISTFWQTTVVSFLGCVHKSFSLFVIKNESYFCCTHATFQQTLIFQGRVWRLLKSEKQIQANEIPWESLIRFIRRKRWNKVVLIHYKVYTLECRKLEIKIKEKISFWRAQHKFPLGLCRCVLIFAEDSGIGV